MTEPVCGARRASAVQRTVLRCEGQRDHGGDHRAHTEWGGGVSWSDRGRVRFAPGRGAAGRMAASAVQAGPSVQETAVPVLSAGARRLVRTDRQADVLGRLVAGGDVASIASALGVGTPAVRKIIRGLAIRFGTTSIPTMIALARRGSEGEAGGVSRPA